MSLATLHTVQIITFKKFRSGTGAGSGITIYEPMIYTAPCVMVLMLPDTLRWEVGGGWPWKWRGFWALWNGIEPIGECHLGPKKLQKPANSPVHPARAFTSLSLFLPWREGVGGEQCGNVTLPHCSRYIKPDLLSFLFQCPARREDESDLNIHLISTHLWNQLTVDFKRGESGHFHW